MTRRPALDAKGPLLPDHVTVPRGEVATIDTLTNFAEIPDTGGFAHNTSCQDPTWTERWLKAVVSQHVTRLSHQVCAKPLKVLTVTGGGLSATRLYV